MHMRIYVTGPCRLSVDGIEVRVPHRQRQVLSLLVLMRGHVVTATEVERVLWGGGAPPTARKAVQTHILGLRRHCGPAILSIAGGYVMAAGDDGVEVDVDTAAFEVAALRAMRVPVGAAVDAAGLAEAALAHWHGRPYAEIEDHDLVTPERERLIRLHRQVLAIRDWTTTSNTAPRSGKT